MMFTTDEIAGFVREETAYDGRIAPETTLQRDVGVFGDDMSDLLDAYSSRFSVDMSRYLWYFHTGEEGWNIGALFFQPPYARVAEIPITIQMIHEFANRGQWAVAYPEHSLPARRYDILICQAVVWLLSVGVVTLLAIKWLG